MVSDRGDGQRDARRSATTLHLRGAQIQIAVAPGIELGRPAQGLSGADAAATLLGAMDDEHSAAMPTRLRHDHDAPVRSRNLWCEPEVLTCFRPRPSPQLRLPHGFRKLNRSASRSTLCAFTPTKAGADLGCRSAPCAQASCGQTRSGRRGRSRCRCRVGGVESESS